MIFCSAFPVARRSAGQIIEIGGNDAGFGIYRFCKLTAAIIEIFDRCAVFKGLLGYPTLTVIGVLDIVTVAVGQL